MRLAALLLLLGLAVVGGLPACGGGGGGDDSGGDDSCVPIGVRRRLAAAGEPAPGTGGNFAPFGLQPPLAAARGGWVAFVAPTTDATKTSVCYVAQPDGTLVEAFAVGDTVPDASGGTISSIDAVRVNPGGLVLVLVSIAGDGGGRTRGLLTALVAGGTAGSKNDVLYDGSSAVPLNGNFSDFVAKNLFLADDGYTFVEATTTTGDEGIFRIDADGTPMDMLAGTGTNVSGSAAVDTIEEVALGPGAARIAFLTERNDGDAGIYTITIGLAGIVEIVEEGDAVDTHTLADLPAGQALTLSANGWVYFRAETTMLLDLLMVGAPASTPIVLVEEGTEEPNTEGTFEDPRWLRNHFDAEGFMFTSELGTNVFGITIGIWGVSDANLLPRFLIANGGTAQALQEGEEFGANFPGLGAAGRFDLGPAASLAFANVLNSGRSGLFWRLPSVACLITTIAVSGETHANDTFNSTNAWFAAAARDVVVFRAPLVTAGSGIFRQGPN
jgi:hypothetical protein